MQTDIHNSANMAALAAASLGAVGAPMRILAETTYEVEARNAAGELLWIDKVHNRVVTQGLNLLLSNTLGAAGTATPTWFIGMVGPSITDAAITTGTAALTSASNPWTAADAGRAIIVRGAGASGADLVTTILTYSSAGAVTLAANAGGTVTGAKAVWDARAADVMSSHAPWVESVAYSNSTRPAFTPGTAAAGSIDNSASKAVFNINVDNTYVGGLFMSDSSTKSGTTGNLYGMAPFASPGFRQVNSGDTLTVTATATVAAT